MRRATLLRSRMSDHGTFGSLRTDGLRWLHTAEPPWRGNRRCRSSIPDGTYRVRPHRSPRFGRCLLVEDVPDRDWILMHGGNLAGDLDKGLRSHTLGCVLPGFYRGELAGQEAVLASQPALRAMLALLGHDPFILDVRSAWRTDLEASPC